MTSHTVTYKLPGGAEREVTREVFESRDGRLLGTEYETTRQYRGWDGWQTIGPTPTDTRHFVEGLPEAQRWLDDLFLQHEVAHVAASGGTKLVIVS